MTDERSLCLGFSFTSDISMFKKSLPKLNFYNAMSRFLDIQTYYLMAVMKQKGGHQIGLSKVVELVLAA